MTDQKDHLGDKLRDAERAREDQYFSAQDRKLIEKIRQGQHGTADSAAPASGLGNCPKCGAPLRQLTLRDVAIDECPDCHGIWLDKGELARVASRESEGFVAHWVRQTLLK